MDANLLQSIVVWAALGLGLASVICCALSRPTRVAQPELGEAPLCEADQKQELDVEEAA